VAIDIILLKESRAHSPCRMKALLQRRNAGKGTFQKALQGDEVMSGNEAWGCSQKGRESCPGRRSLEGGYFRRKLSNPEKTKKKGQLSSGGRRGPEAKASGQHQRLDLNLTGAELD